MRLIDADALMEVFRGERGGDALDHFPLRLIKVRHIVDDAPTIDAIPVEWLEKQMELSHENSAIHQTIDTVIGLWDMEQEGR